MDRPSLDSIKAGYSRLFGSSIPLSRLRDASATGRLLHYTDGTSLVGRSMLWKVFLIHREPLIPSSPDAIAVPPIESLRKLRAEYADLLAREMRMPDGSYEEGLSIPGRDSLPRNSTYVDVQQNNPLSLDDNNPWKSWFAAVELRKTLRQDVERTFPDIDYFRDLEVQSQLTLILYIYSVTHPDIGYRQGMHELLAPLYFALDYDSIPDGTECNAEISEFSSQGWLAADAWALFNAVMSYVGSWYEWREPQEATLPSPLKNPFLISQDGSIEPRPFVAPIVQTCQHLQSVLLKMVDPTLWDGLQKTGIEPQIYGIRWLRLLFTREFSFSDAMIIWDGLFANESPADLAPWICVAMLIRIRNQLLPSDYTGQLTQLLRYPGPGMEIDTSAPHHAVLLLQQALMLQTAPNPYSGANIVVENRNLLNIPIDVPQPVIGKRMVRVSDQSRNNSALNQRSGGSFNSRTRKDDGSAQIGLPEIFARGLLEKGESLGINRTVMNAVSELRKNLPEIANQWIRSPSDENSYLSYPLHEEEPSQERPPWEPKTRKETEREILELKLRQKLIGEAVKIAVDSLLLDEKRNESVNFVEDIRHRKREALESLSYVRDVLLGNPDVVDEERLFGETEYKHRMAAQKASQSTLQNTTKTGVILSRVSAPRPAVSFPVSHNESQSRSMIESPHPLTSLPRTSTKVTSRPFIAATTESPSDLNPPRPIGPAPWNSTRSNLTASSTSPNLPKISPPASATLSNNLQHSRSKTAHPGSYDPLGALP